MPPQPPEFRARAVELGCGRANMRKPMPQVRCDQVEPPPGDGPTDLDADEDTSVRLATGNLG